MPVIGTCIAQRADQNGEVGWKKFKVNANWGTLQDELRHWPGHESVADLRACLS